METAATIFNIQKFSTHDGPGIRTTIFFKGCSLSCQWCANPESNNQLPEILYFHDKCTNCKKCIQACNYKALISNINSIDFHSENCQNCFSCINICSSNARKLSGASMTIDQVMKEIKKDSVFYNCSGGGVTFSGGEPLLWPNFLLDIGKQVKALGFNTTIETCGFFPKKNISKVKKIIDLALFDIKFIDNNKHIFYCGTSNELILNNFKSIVTNIPTIVRIPIIPTINDNLSDLQKIVEFLEPYKQIIQEINLLPYHNLGVGKYDALGRRYLLEHLIPPSNEYMQNIKKYFACMNFSVRIE